MGTQAQEFHNPGAVSSENFPYPAEICEAFSAWRSAKDRLQQSMRREDYQSFVRPMYLCALLCHRFLLIALPPSRRIIERAYNFRRNLSRVIAAEGFFFAGYTPYPDASFVWDNPSFGPFVEMMYRGQEWNLSKRRSRQDQRSAREMLLFLRRQSESELECLARDPHRSPRMNFLAGQLLSERQAERMRDEATLESL